MTSHKNYRFFDVDAGVYPAATRHGHPAFELDESDIYDSLGPSLERPRMPEKRIEHPRRDQISRKVTSSSSLPVNIPDWSKILKGEEYRKRGGVEEDYFDEEEEGNDVGVARRDWLPPHEFLVRTRIKSSFSVHEGAGRTLKGRDLGRVRNAIWAKTGFQD